MDQVDSDTDHEAESNPLHFIAPSILEQLTHLNLAGRLTSKKTKVVAGGAYGDISRGRCFFADRGMVRVAIKCLRFYLKDDIQLLFEKEIYVWSKLRHTNILPLLGYDIDNVSGYPLLVSEWMNNGSAWTYVNSHLECDLMHLFLTRFKVTGIARGLTYLHEESVVHSDIKSDNILVSESGDALICDFGCSRMIAASRSLANLSSGIKGSSRYLAYELLAPKHMHETSHTMQTDVWAFGMTMFELSTRQRPYASLSDVQAIAAIIREEVPSFPPVVSLGLQSEVMTVLKDICLACWDPLPVNRPVMSYTLDALETSAGRHTSRESPLGFSLTKKFVTQPPLSSSFEIMDTSDMHSPQHPHQGAPGTNGPPQTPLAHSHGLPVSSPRQPPPLLQTPGTPPAGVSAPLPSAGARLNTNANAFVPSRGAPTQSQRQSRIKITDASGELDLNWLRKQGGTPSTSSTPASGKFSQRATVQSETEESRLKRITEEEREQKAKEEEERKKRQAKDAGERKRWEEEERVKAEKEKAKDEGERKRKEEEERQRKEEEKKERIRSEEERKRKEEEEKERLRKEEEERLRKEEEERQRKEAEEEQRLQKEEKEAKAKAEAEAEKSRPVALEIKSKKEGEVSSTVSDVPLSTLPETSKRRPIPGPLDLSSTHKSIPQPLPSALATARHIQDVYQVQYPEGIKSPNPELNTNAKDGKFRYDRDFLLQFMSVCKEKPDNFPPLEAIGLKPSNQSHSMGRGNSGHRGVSGSMGPPSSTASRQASIGLGIGALNGFGGKPGSGFAMGNFSAPNKLSSEERFMRSTSMSGGPGGLPFAGGRPSPMVRSSSQGGAGAMGNKRTRSKRGDSTRNESNRISASANQFNANAASSFEPVAPLEQSANRWVAGSTSRRGASIDPDSPEIVDKKVRSLLNKLTMEKFESISNQIIAWANKSESEKDGRTLIQVIRLVFEKATDEAAWSEMYARLCRKMMEQISPNVQDDGIRNAEGKPITGGLLFRKYLLNRCQKESIAAVALVKVTEDQAVKNANEVENKEAGESALYSDEYYVAQKAKRQGLGLVKFISELFKLQILTERIMHECIKKLLINVDNPEEEEIESLCILLTTVGQALDTSKARGHMDVYFSRMKELAKSSNMSSRMQFMLRDVIELRERKWTTRTTVAAPSTIAQVHEAAAKEKAQQELHNLWRSAMFHGGSRRGHSRDGNAQEDPDGWAVASVPSRPANKADDLSNFGKVQEGNGALDFGPASAFTKKGDSKRDSASLPRTSSNTNMFQMLQAAEAANEAPTASSSRPSRPSSRTTSVDLTHNTPVEPAQPAQRPRLNLLPRSKPIQEKSENSPAETHDGEEGEEGEILEKDSGKSSMSKEQAEKKIDQDRKEFFAIRDLDEAEEYFSALPSEHRHLLVEKLVMSAIEAKEADAKLVADLFERALSRNLCSPASFEEGFLPVAELLDDIAIDAPKAFSLIATMMKGAKLDEERRTRVASKSMDSDKLLILLA